MSSKPTMATSPGTSRPRRLQACKCTNCNQIVVAEERGQLGVLGQQALGRSQAVFDDRRTVADPVIRRLNVQLSQRSAIADGTSTAAVGCSGAGHVADGTMTALQEMGRGQKAARHVVYHHCR